MAVPRAVQAVEHVGMLSAAPRRRKRAKNVQREIKMREEREIVGSTWAKKMIVTDTAKFVQMDVADVTKFVKIDVADAVQFVTSARRVKQHSRTRTRGNSETCESRGGEFVGGSRRRT